MSKPTAPRPEVETLQRARRIETRVTQILQHLGIPTGSQMPDFDESSGRVTLPSAHCSIKDVIDSTPDNWQGPVTVYLGQTLVATLTTPGQTS